MLVTGRFLHVVLMLGKLPLTLSTVFYRTVLWVIFIYNSETTCSILTNFSGNKRSGMKNMLAKFCCPKMVDMETVTDSLFFCNARYLSRESRYYLEVLGICSPGAKLQFMFRTYFPQTYRISVIMKQSLHRVMWMHGPKQCFLLDQCLCYPGKVALDNVESFL